MTTKYVTEEYSICGCCLQALANADTSGHDAYCDGEPEPMNLWHGDRYIECVPNGLELGFATSRCEGCGSRLAGDRYGMVTLTERKGE